ncbi:hypothetical protein HYC85_004065 [Camellia sinensis]|uniref:Uncharacterized protein n=1 Tax=Camellia sinensis TaxID=4442 RepID=A0A7J7HVF0_CAMSI|nr:hypothetical protein HYC85_004065 [Camellia sinensis]
MRPMLVTVTPLPRPLITPPITPLQEREREREREIEHCSLHIVGTAIRTTRSAITAITTTALQSSSSVEL